MNGLCPECGFVDFDEACDEGLCAQCQADELREAQAECDSPMGLDDDGGCFDDGEPADIDSDEGFDVYAGGPESDGYDTGCDDF